MYSTVTARQHGAVEANPMMAGSYSRGAAVKVLMAATTIAAVRVIEKKNKKAAAIALIAMNGVTAAVVVNNMKNARR